MGDAPANTSLWDLTIPELSERYGRRLVGGVNLAVEDFERPINAAVNRAVASQYGVNNPDVGVQTHTNTDPQPKVPAQAPQPAPGVPVKPTVDATSDVARGSASQASDMAGAAVLNAKMPDFSDAKSSYSGPGRVVRPAKTDPVMGGEGSPLSADAIAEAMDAARKEFIGGEGINNALSTPGSKTNDITPEMNAARLGYTGPLAKHIDSTGKEVTGGGFGGMTDMPFSQLPPSFFTGEAQKAAVAKAVAEQRDPLGMAKLLAPILLQTQGKMAEEAQKHTFATEEQTAVNSRLDAIDREGASGEAAIKSSFPAAVLATPEGKRQFQTKLQSWRDSVKAQKENVLTSARREKVTGREAFGTGT